MGKLIFSLETFIKMSNYQEWQDKLSDYLQIAIVTVDFKGHPVTKHSNCSDFCKSFRDKNTNKSLCEDCDSLAGIEAAKSMKPYIYICHKGLVDIAIPILYNDIYLGAMMIGQIVLDDQNKILELNQIKTRTQIINESDAALAKLPRMSHARIKAIADLLFFFVNNYMGTQIEKISNQAEKIEFDKNYIKENKISNIIEPAIEYINVNFENKISLIDLAELCSVTPSYFSKLFKKIMNISLTDYINTIRIEKAKLLLVTTKGKITHISNSLGFSDAGYFIKVFKQITGMTPVEYRYKTLD